MPRKKLPSTHPFTGEVTALMGVRDTLSPSLRQKIDSLYGWAQQEKARSIAKILSPGFEREDTSWQDQGLCISGVDPEIFFPMTNDEKRDQLWRVLCDACPVRELCGDYGMRHDFQGVWGGVYRPGPLLSARPKGRPPKTSYSRARALERVS